MNFRILLPAFAICCMTIKLQGQRNYYATADKLVFGASIIKDSDIQNAKLCQVRKGGKILKFFPNELK